MEHLHAGQFAQVVAVGFDQREASPIRGDVRLISADRVTDPRSGRGFFKVEVDLVADQQDGALLHKLRPGMPVQVVVPVTPRSPLQYLIGPLRSSFRGAWREP